ncbi:MAG TPA: DUF4442 domain-containing protein [Spongiibacteraceae bacterium]|jgi:acyl-coenzyme A thioesterase PaaI-like protein
MNSVATWFGIDIRNPNRIVKTSWDLLRGNRAGRYLFGCIVGIAAPYSGNIGATILELREGYARVAIKDRHKLRNHLKSIHAIALANLAEYTANIALAYSIPSSARFIVTRMSSEYLKKARGKIIAECTLDELSVAEEIEKSLRVTLTNAQNEIVAVFTVHSLIRMS